MSRATDHWHGNSCLYYEAEMLTHDGLVKTHFNVVTALGKGMIERLEIE